MYKHIKLDYARNSLRYVIRFFGIKNLYIPYYLCDVVRHSVIQENCKPIFYHIDENFYPQNVFDKDDYILYPNYFGICDENVRKLTLAYPNLIVDNAHSYFSSPSGLATFNSQRKFQPVDCGSDLWIKNNQELPKIEGLIYLKDEKFYSEVELEKVKENRKQDFLTLHERYSFSNKLEIDVECESPFCYPYLAENEEIADTVAKSLQKEGKTIYRYWQCLPKTYLEYKFYSRLVPIPLD